MQKMKKDAIGGIQRHNQREGKESKNKDIDKEKGHLNYDLVNQHNISYPKSIQEMTDERVQRKVRADAVLVSEFFVSASPEYMKGLTDQEQEKYFETAFDHLSEKYGDENILYATVHKDESTPHMHLGVVPITEDGRLSAKDFFHGKTKIRAIQDDFHKHMTSQGFEIERGEPSEKKHKDVHQFKVDQKKKELEQLDVQIEHKKESLSIYRASIKAQQSNENEEPPKKEIPVETPMTSTIPFKKDKVIIDKDDLDDLVERSNHFREKLNEEKSTSHGLQQNFNRIKEDYNEMVKQFGKTQQRLKGFVNDKDAEVEKAKKAMRAKVMKDFTEEKRSEIKGELKAEVEREVVSSYKGELSQVKAQLEDQAGKRELSEKKLAIAEKRLSNKDKQLEDTIQEANQRINIANEKLETFADRLNNSVDADYAKGLVKKNDELQEKNRELQGWKDRMIEWGKKSLKKIPELAESFFKSAGMEKEASKYQDELER